ncbi:hypothetical protein [Halalkalicoccus jeotgali]|uniref:Small CPxCG-related zinc finger protein n=1 Tax=Halalkalicoccus jeotgali (strain DSM 18796 / CECT 7217 / JCM 14584 / KCTC 4019 / B3) TaxID=795797 RepID=D8JA68_HALJB|nr:hypothetical protein [Halalkalicoccus jeotgali]ADJ14590.1 hypothetical protein HacjB3_05995 [Halalkalicoccus jeotgali B3]ELY39962.1 hypothetical protein C497_04377 [Halalkalicoccus jeotgali B3]
MASVQADSRCLNCGFTAASGSDEWAHVAVPKLGTLTQCPECNSTNVTSGR